MGRQAYLDKLAFGRSAFEPTQSVTQSAEYIQLESSQSEIPRQYQEATENAYMQLYDERGNAVNPRSHEYGKKLRDAQNDVLASVGVVERRRAPAEGLPGSYEEEQDLLEAEDTVGGAIALASILSREFIFTWWVGVLRDRVLTFHFPDTMNFTTIVASERAVSGSSLMYTGSASMVTAMFAQTFLSGLGHYQPMRRLLSVTRASAKTRSLFRKLRGVFASCSFLAAEILIYPFSYHTYVQRLGLIPPRPFLPSWRSFIPFSASSPLLPLSPYYDASASMADCFKALVTSPIVLVITKRYLDLLVLGCIHEAIQSCIIRPYDAFWQYETVDSKSRAFFPGLQDRVPSSVRTTLRRVLAAVGWAYPLPKKRTENDTRSNQDTSTLQGNHILDVGPNRVSNVAPLPVNTSRTQQTDEAEVPSENVITVPLDSIDEMIRPATPPSPRASPVAQDDNDPRIRITNRGGVVEMEVRLPPRILSSYTELESQVVSSDFEDTHPQNRPPPGGDVKCQRVTHLSATPASSLGMTVDFHIAGFVLIPVKFVMLRLITSHFLSTHGNHIDRSSGMRLLPRLADLSWRSVGVQVTRIALCHMLDFTIGLGVWGLQYVAITKLGISSFGWGSL